MENFIAYCKNHILDNIDEFVGVECCGADIAMEIMRDASSCGTLTYSTDKAIDYINVWWSDCGDYLKYQMDIYGNLVANPFHNPEKFMVGMVEIGVYNILSECSAVTKVFNEMTTIDEEMVAAIKEFVDEFDDSDRNFIF